MFGFWGLAVCFGVLVLSLYNINKLFFDIDSRLSFDRVQAIYMKRLEKSQDLVKQELVFYFLDLKGRVLKFFLWNLCLTVTIPAIAFQVLGYGKGLGWTMVSLVFLISVIAFSLIINYGVNDVRRDFLARLNN